MHLDIGGATPAKWCFCLLVRHDQPWPSHSLRRPRLPPTSIFNMIDDKIGGRFKSIPQQAYQTLKNSSDQAWDLGANPTSLEYWARCPSVFSPSKPVTRELAFHELAALRDSMLPDVKELSANFCRDLLISLLHGPPGKLLWKVAYGPLRHLWRQLDLPAIQAPLVDRKIDYISTTVEDQAIKGLHLKASRVMMPQLTLKSGPGQTSQNSRL